MSSSTISPLQRELVNFLESMQTSSTTEAVKTTYEIEEGFGVVEPTTLGPNVNVTSTPDTYDGDGPANTDRIAHFEVIGSTLKFILETLKHY